MPGLIVRLGPNERLYINGAVIENGARRTELCLPLADTEILRERDIIEAPAATDTLGAACVLAQMALMRRDGRELIVARLKAQFRALLRDPAHRENPLVLQAAQRLSDGALSGAHYLLLRALRQRGRADAPSEATADTDANAAAPGIGGAWCTP